MSGNTGSVLAVDDHPVNRDLLARQLDVLGYCVETAQDGREAFARWQHDTFALVITDCHMPVMDGYALVRAIREAEQREGRARTPVVAWTADGMAAELARCRDAGVDDVLPKPSSLDALRALIQRLLCMPLPARPGAGPAVAGPDAPPAAVLDLTALREIAAAAEVQQRILRDFRMHVSREHRRLAEAMAAGDAACVAEHAHRLTGASRMVGAGQLADACKVLERDVRNGAVGLLPMHLTAIDAALAALEPWLDKVGGEGRREN